MNLFGSIFKFQDPPVMLVAFLINFGVKNQVPGVSFKIVVGIRCQFSLMSLLILYFVNHWLFLKLYHIMDLSYSLSTVTWILYLSI